MLLSEIKFFKNVPIRCQKLLVKCDVCDKEYFLSYYYYIDNVNRNGKLICKSCITSKMCKGKTFIDRMGLQKSLEIKEKMSFALKGKKPNRKNRKWTKEQKENLKRVRPNKGTFEELYGKEKALKIKKNMSKATSGKNNPMYGKPSPKGSGNGWSGWYKGRYFRSLLELTYMVRVLENVEWESAEKSKYNIPYIDWNGIERSYFPDFVVGNKIIEIKPKNLKNSKNVLLKEAAAIKWCNENNFEYIIVSDIEKLSNEEIKTLYDLKLIKFIDRYEEKYRNLWRNM